MRAFFSPSDAVSYKVEYGVVTAGLKLYVGLLTISVSLTLAQVKSDN